jgi:hypothetical protein
MQERLWHILRTGFSFLSDLFVRSQQHRTHAGQDFAIPVSKQGRGITKHNSHRGNLENSIESWRPVGFKGNRLQKRLAGPCFNIFSANGITVGLQNRSAFSLLASVL